MPTQVESLGSIGSKRYIMKAVASPCTGICELDSQGLCLGCRRSGAEIALWLDYSDQQRQRLMDEVLPVRPMVAT